MITCEHCEKDLASKNSLYVHQRKAKYCLKIQEKNKLIDPIPVLNCKACNKEFLLERCLERHKEKCYFLLKQEIALLKKEGEKLKEENLKLRKEIEHEKSIVIIYRDMNEDNKKTLEEIAKSERDCIQEIAKQVKTTNKISNKYNFTGSFDPYGEEFRNKLKEGYTDGHFLDGQKGLARLVGNTVMSDSYRVYHCGDPIRGVFYYKDADDNIVKDFGARRMAESTFKTLKLYVEETKDKMQGRDEMNESEKFQIVSTPYINIMEMDKNKNSGSFLKELATRTS